MQEAARGEAGDRDHGPIPEGWCGSETGADAGYPEAGVRGVHLGQVIKPNSLRSDRSTKVDKAWLADRRHYHLGSIPSHPPFVATFIFPLRARQARGVKI